MTACVLFLVFDSSFSITITTPRTVDYIVLSLDVPSLALRCILDGHVCLDTTYISCVVSSSNRLTLGNSIGHQRASYYLVPVTDFVTLTLVFVFEFFVVPCPFVSSHETEWASHIVGRLFMVRLVPISVFTSM